MIKESNPLAGLGDRTAQGEANARRHLKNCVFVSHSSKDWSFIQEHNIEETLHQALSVATYTQKHGTWTYPYGIFCFSFAKLQNLYASTVGIALKECRAFVFVASQNATQSEWVRRELTYADRHIPRVLAILIDGTSFRECVDTIGVPNIFRANRRVLSVQLDRGVPNQTTNLLCVASEYFRSRYKSRFGLQRPPGNPIRD